MGDMAMLGGLAQALREATGAVRFTIVGTRAHCVTLSDGTAMEVVSAWEGWQGTIAFDRLLRDYDGLYVLGADILDGKYGAGHVCRIAAYCNHAIRAGVPVTILGFSFNRAPRGPAVRALARLRPEIRINVRDEPSLNRFTSTVALPGTLCADVAFLMPPATEGPSELEAWVRQTKERGRIPVGVNVNAHAFSDVIARIGSDEMVFRFAKNLAAAGTLNNLAFLLIPHDFKASSGDVVLLRKLEAALAERRFPAVRYESLADPAVIKRVAGLLDLVITGRMHLAISSLGMGTPILSIPYQDKFEGLYDHFQLPKTDIVDPDVCLSEVFVERISQAVEQRRSTAQKIRTALPRVGELARRNIRIG
jgi:colanic acid/amylovoran biosynthesis protein